MSTSRFVLVTGATGQQGGSAVKALLANGHRVRGLTRNAGSASAQRLAAQGVEVVEGDFTDHASLVRAATGVDTVFTMTTPFEKGMEAETAQGLAMLKAVQEAGVGHLIYTSVASANQATGIPHFDSKYAVEEAIVASGIPYTIMAPVFFMENYLQPWAGLPQGKISLAMPGTTPLQQIAVADIGAFAAALVDRRETVFGRRYDIAGDELTNDAVATALSDVIGQPLQYQGFPAEAMRAHSEDMAIMFEWFETTGYSTDIDALRREFPEVGWHRFKEWATAQAWDLVPA